MSMINLILSVENINTVLTALTTSQQNTAALINNVTSQAQAQLQAAVAQAEQAETEGGAPD